MSREAVSLPLHTALGCALCPRSFAHALPSNPTAFFLLFPKILYYNGQAGTEKVWPHPFFVPVSVDLGIPPPYPGHPVNNVSQFWHLHLA